MIMLFTFFFLLVTTRCYIILGAHFYTFLNYLKTSFLVDLKYCIYIWESMLIIESAYNIRTGEKGERLFSVFLMNMSKAKNITRKHFRSKWKLVTEREKEQFFFQSLGENSKAKKCLQKALSIRMETGDIVRRSIRLRKPIVGARVSTSW